jgi:hypothetical protein
MRSVEDALFYLQEAAVHAENLIRKIENGEYIAGEVALANEYADILKHLCASWNVLVSPDKAEIQNPDKHFESVAHTIPNWDGEFVLVEF